jgi:hypothetical protein
MGGYTKRHFHAKQHMLGKTVQEKNTKKLFPFFKINMSCCRPMDFFPLLLVNKTMYPAQARNKKGRFFSAVYF